MGARAGCGGAGLYHLRRGRRQGDPIAKNLDAGRIAGLARCGGPRRRRQPSSSSATRKPVAEEVRRRGCAASWAARLGLIDAKEFRFCWIVDFPDVRARCGDQTRSSFSHNPFLDAPGAGSRRWRPGIRWRSRPSNTTSSATAWSFSSGAIRKPSAGDHVQGPSPSPAYGQEEVEGALRGACLNALKFGRPAPMAARRRASTGSSCSWPMSAIIREDRRLPR